MQYGYNVQLGYDYVYGGYWPHLKNAPTIVNVRKPANVVTLYCYAVGGVSTEGYYPGDDRDMYNAFQYGLLGWHGVLHAERGLFAFVDGHAEPKVVPREIGTDYPPYYPGDVPLGFYTPESVVEGISCNPEY